MVAPLVVIAGTGVGERAARIAYQRWLQPSPARVFTLPGRGLGRIEDTYAELEVQLVDWLGWKRVPAVVVGHSQGCIHALRFAVDHPRLVEHVVSVAGPLAGTTAAQAPAVLPIVEALQPGSNDLHRLQFMARNRLTRPVTLIAGHHDALVRPRRSAFELPVPWARKIYLAPELPPELPADVEWVNSRWCGHTSMMWSPEVTGLIQETRGVPSTRRAARSSG